MGHIYYKIWIHTVWSIKERNPLLTKEIRFKFFNHIFEKARESGYHLEMINGVADHCHALLSLNPKYAISEVLNILK